MFCPEDFERMSLCGCAFRTILHRKEHSICLLPLCGYSSGYLKKWRVAMPSNFSQCFVHCGHSSREEAIERLVDGYLEAVRSRKLDHMYARELFGVLLEPIIEEQTAKRLIIVPDGKLNLVPFDALRDSEGRFVLESHVVTYAPSATVLHLLRESRSAIPAMRNFIGVGGVVYSSSTLFGNKSKVQEPKSTDVADFFGVDSVTFPDLPGSTQEVVGAAKIIGGSNQLLLDGNATEGEFKAQPPSEFQIIHLAVHGLAIAEFPDRAALVLGSSAASGEDGLLQVREIRDLSLHAELVTLSACDTWDGKTARSGGNRQPRTGVSSGWCKICNCQSLARR